MTVIGLMLVFDVTECHLRSSPTTSNSGRCSSRCTMHPLPPEDGPSVPRTTQHLRTTSSPSPATTIHTRGTPTCLISTTPSSRPRTSSQDLSSTRLCRRPPPARCRSHPSRRPLRNNSCWTASTTSAYPPTPPASTSTCLLPTNLYTSKYYKLIVIVFFFN